ncbi:MAG: AAA family ATPase [Bacteroidota bacterium]
MPENKDTLMQGLPISTHTFEKIRNRNYLYVDKTPFIEKLVNSGTYFFLSRPRRFGKSLMLTTLKAFFEGKKELFEGLYIAEKEQDWTVYPVIHIDYSLVAYKRGRKIFDESLIFNLQHNANQYDIKLSSANVSDAFLELVAKLQEKYQQKVVVLVDEYDKPIIDMLGKEEQFLENREVLRSLYTNFKGLDQSLHFVMLTGVSRFSKVSIFSGLNNLEDISNNDEYSTIVGFTQQELEAKFEPYFQGLQNKLSIDRQRLLELTKIWYNGFSFDGEHRLYNPFSILNLFKQLQFENYWFSTGTPTFLMDLIKEQQQLPEELEGIKVNDLVGSSLQLKEFPLLPILYQTGYLAMRSKEWDGFQIVYCLDYPNFEVKHSFLTFLTAAFKRKDEFVIQNERLHLRDTLLEERVEDFVKRLQSFLADIPARLHLPKEAYYHSLVYLVLRIIGFQLILEKETDKGRIDAVLELNDKIYIIEFKFGLQTKVKKVETLSRNALKQIQDKKYYEAYLSSGKRILLLGLGFLDKKLHGRVKELEV